MPEIIHYIYLCGYTALSKFRPQFRKYGIDKNVPATQRARKPKNKINGTILKVRKINLLDHDNIDLDHCTATDSADA